MEPSWSKAQRMFSKLVPPGTARPRTSCYYSACQMTGNVVLPNIWREAMKTIVSALIALSVLAGIAAPASAMDAKTFYEQQDRVSY
jgi:ABC-type phosphate/phosphonate transport system permease subunit